MITDRTDRCPECGGIVKYRDKTKRMIRLEYGQREYIKISRFKCVSCGKIHRALPKELTPYKHYKTELINNMINDVVTTDDVPYENYPVDLTVQRWKKSYFDSEKTRGA